MADRIQMETGVTGPDAPEQRMEVVEDTTEAERPEWLPEKFESPEAMAKAYGELESKMGDTPADTEDDGYEYYEEGEDPVEAAGISSEALEEFSAEFFQNGDLSEESLARIETEFGIPQDISKAYVDGQKAMVTQAQDSIFNEVGGKETYTDMLSWARDNMSEADIAAYDAAIISNDIHTAKMVAKGLHAQYAAANGQAPNLTRGNASPTGGGEGYQSWQQVSADMQNPKYGTDPAFRQQVQNKLAVSNLQQ